MSQLADWEQALLLSEGTRGQLVHGMFCKLPCLPIAPTCRACTELRLPTGTLPSAAALLLDGQYASALRDTLGHVLPAEVLRHAGSISDAYSALRAHACSAVASAVAAGDQAALCQLFLAGAAALCTFTQHNLTG